MSTDWDDPPSGTFAAEAISTFRKRLAEEYPTYFDAQLARITAEAVAECQFAISKALQERFGQPLSEETAWLIEWPSAPGFQPRWWHPVNGWTTDASRATRYARKIDAEGHIERGCFVVGVCATEHAWLTPSAGGGDGR